MADNSTDDLEVRVTLLEDDVTDLQDEVEEMDTDINQLDDGLLLVDERVTENSKYCSIIFQKSKQIIGYVWN